MKPNGDQLCDKLNNYGTRVDASIVLTLAVWLMINMSERTRDIQWMNRWIHEWSLFRHGTRMWYRPELAWDTELHWLTFFSTNVIVVKLILCSGNHDKMTRHDKIVIVYIGSRQKVLFYFQFENPYNRNKTPSGRGVVVGNVEAEASRQTDQM